MWNKLFQSAFGLKEHHVRYTYTNVVFSLEFLQVVYLCFAVVLDVCAPTLQLFPEFTMLEDCFAWRSVYVTSV